MSAFSMAVRDSATMLRRDARHSQRNIATTVTGILVPVIMLTLFNYFFGGAIGAGLGGAHGGSYINFLLPGILIMAIGSGCETTALNLCMDMSEGVITRFRTMAIARSSVLTGQVIGSLIRTTLSVVVVLGVGLLMGFRTPVGPVAWIEVLGLVVLFTLGITWMGVLFGLIGKTPAGANSLALLFTLLAFTSSAFVPLDSIAPGVRWFAQYQPFTPVIDTVRGLLVGTPVTASSVLLAVGWSVVFILAGYLGARAVYNRDPVR
jgi:ABC-2 type transport system permease protein